MKKAIGILTLVCMLVSLMPLTALAAPVTYADLAAYEIVTGSNPGGNPKTEKTADAIYTYDFSNNDGFNSKGMRHSGLLLLPTPVTGDFEISATVDPIVWYRKKTGAVIGVGLFADESGSPSTTNYFSLVQRGDNETITAYYWRADTSKLAAVGTKAEPDASGATEIVLKRTGTTITALVGGVEVHSAVSGTAEKNYPAVLDGAGYLGLVFDGCDAKVTNLKITVGGEVVYDQSADATVSALHASAPTASATLTVNDSVAEGIGVDWALDFAAAGYDALEITATDLSDNEVYSTTVLPADGNSGTVSFVPEASGSYTFTAKGLYRENGEIKDGPAATASATYVVTIEKPTVAASNTATGEVTLMWADQSAATGWKVAYKAASDTDWTEADITPEKDGDTLKYAVTGLTVGTEYAFTVTVTDGTLSHTSDEVTATPETIGTLWQTSIFGSSSKEPTAENIAANKYCNVTVQGDGSVLIESVGGAGKLQDQHDGIAFYYTTIPAAQNVILSADVKLTYHGTAGTAGDNKQQSFGIMMRDVPGKYEGLSDSTYGYSNMVALAPYDLTRPMLALCRSGVQAGASASSELTNISFTKTNLTVGYPTVGTTYHMEIQKDNTGFKIRLTDPVTGTVDEHIYYNEDYPNLLLEQDKDNYYVGFFASREAKIEVSNISLTTSIAANDPPAEPKPIIPTEPVLAITSADKTGNAAYDLTFTANFTGKASVTRGEEVLASDIAVVSGKNTVALTLNEGENALSLTIKPDAEGQVLTTYADQVASITVNLTNLGLLEQILVSPDGVPGASGAVGNPTDLATAVAYATPGQTLLLAPGTYQLDATLLIPKSSSGTSDKPITMMPYGLGEVILDFGAGNDTGIALADASTAGAGVMMEADYWVFDRITFRNSTDNGMRVKGSHNIIKNCIFCFNGDTGLQLSGNTADSYAEWPSYNSVINCESYMNRDASDGDADGFAAKLSVADGNVFEGCVAHHNSDDGWDLYVRTGVTIGEVTLRDCIAYANGYALDGSATKGDGNGFKLGGESVPVCHTIENCIAYDNRVAGFTANSNPTFKMTDVTSFRNGGSNFVFASNNADYTVSGALSVEGGKEDQNTSSVLSEKNYFSGNEKALASLFASTSAPASVARNIMGDITLGDFLHVTSHEVGADLSGENCDKTGPIVPPCITPAPSASTGPVVTPTPGTSSEPVVTPTPVPTPAPTNKPSHDYDNWVPATYVPNVTLKPVTTDEPVFIVPAVPGSGENLPDVPKTGDTTSVMLPAAVLAAAAAALALVLGKRRQVK